MFTSSSFLVQQRTTTMQYDVAVLQYVNVEKEISCNDAMEVRYRKYDATKLPEI
jgi:hypothetical protein